MRVCSKSSRPSRDADLLPELVDEMAAALTAPTSKVPRFSKPTAKIYVRSVLTQIIALRDGTAEICAGRPMSWSDITERLKPFTCLSMSSISKAFAAELLAAAPPQKRPVKRRARQAQVAPHTAPAMPSASVSQKPIPLDVARAGLGQLFDD